MLFTELHYTYGTAGKLSDRTSTGKQARAEDGSQTISHGMGALREFEISCFGSGVFDDATMRSLDG